MAMSKIAALSLLLAFAEARFGQEQIPVAAVAALGQAGFGGPGVAATIAGSIPGSLLAAAGPCSKLEIADQIIDELGDDQQVIDAAIGLVSAETNFNPFAVDVPFVCADPALPVNEVLRGITPLVDPAVDGSDVANALSASSVATPLDAAGLSQAEVLLTQGFASFTAVDAAGQNIVLAGQDGAGADAGAGDVADEEEEVVVDDGAADEEVVEEDDAAEEVVDEEEEVDAHPIQCGGQVVDDNEGQQGDNEGDNQDDNNEDQHGDNQDDNQEDDAANEDNEEEVVDDGAADDVAEDVGNGGALDFGICQPTIARVGGLNGRPADEFTFIPQDPLVAEGQQEALNPNIITNRICDQLINVCEADAAAIAACEDAQAEIEALGTRDQSTADTWNALLGFAGVDSTVESI